ncbi:hypothetical protein CT19431_MP30211 [Cupriavidus taiwanensis]|nr:hypothetical protein CT19431_MP30211 [Cupriavidus taiwanensis]
MTLTGPVSAEPRPGDSSEQMIFLTVGGPVRPQQKAA